MPVIWGHVEAVTIGVGTRPRILVNACAPGPQETIDAQVSRNTRITRGIQIVSLSDINCGEFIELTLYQHWRSCGGMHGVLSYLGLVHMTEVDVASLCLEEKK